jgi:uncharacterized heparinase superfamily protein
LLAPDRIRLLNQESPFPPTGGWNDPEKDKLWLYNLHYFDDLNSFDAADRNAAHRSLIERWIAENPPGTGNGWEPYPLSIRAVNWIKWLCGGAEPSASMVQSLAVQIRWLRQRIEWHLLGNHLFTNAKALTLAGLFFKGQEAEQWRTEGLRILERELPEQVLPDGGNFERSPMYHALMTEDLLDLVNASGRYPGVVPEEQVSAWRAAAERMLAWLAGLTHPDGRTAQFNDAAAGVAPDTSEIERYAAELAIQLHRPVQPGLRYWKDSGYLRMDRGPAVALLDIAKVGPDYLLGHAHADTLSFELSVRGRRFIVNGGTSRYGSDEIRAGERATAAHSTVEVGGRSSSEVWHGFRVGRRANPFDVDVFEDSEAFNASGAHDGYAWLPGGPVHRRSWRMTDNTLTVDDTLSAAGHSAVARYIIAPGIGVEVVNASIFALGSPDGQRVLLRVEQGEGVAEPAWHSPEFGRRLQTTAIAIRLIDGRARATIRWEQDANPLP